MTQASPYTLSQWQPITHEQYVANLIRVAKQCDVEMVEVVLNTDLTTYDTPNNPDSLDSLSFITWAWVQGETGPERVPYLWLLEVDAYDDGSEVGKPKCFVRKGVALID
jgi:hypothetical protein